MTVFCKEFCRYLTVKCLSFLNLKETFCLKRCCLMLKNCPGTHAALTKSQLVSGPLQTMQTSSDIFSPFSILSLSLSLSLSISLFARVLLLSISLSLFLSFFLSFFLSLSYFLFLFLSISFVNYLVCKHSAASGNRTSNYDPLST